ncbi:MAG: T9SS type A sorting domain-containing protein [Bacteroidetes bacterium]|nr:T9SS type A sorting domain-containing protein [Bacteroidota bacterium]
MGHWKKIFIAGISVSILIFLINGYILAQSSVCPFVDAGPDQNLDCLNNCTSLSATFLQTGLTTSYAVSSIPYAPPIQFSGGTTIPITIDDVWSTVINLPFMFCFYGNIYYQIVVGGNGLISFDTTLANQYCEWQFTDSIPSPGPPPGGLYNNSIMGVYHDLDVSYGGNINYYIIGNTPCRMFIINFDTIPHFDCNCFLFADCKKSTTQIVLYETTNIIEVYIENKETCSSWNNGSAVMGIQDATGNAGVAPPGRNTGLWSANNEGWRFTPTGAPNYNINWIIPPNNPVGNGITMNVCPPNTTTYIAEVIYDNCYGNPVSFYDTVVVNIAGGFTISTSQTNTVCGACTGSSLVTAIGGTPPYSFNIGFGNQPTGDFASLCAGIYSVTITDSNGCVNTADINIEQPYSITLTLGYSDSTCGNSDGFAFVAADGGSPPYSYLWNDSLSQTGDTAVSLASGTFSVTVVDANGCTTTGSVYVAEPPLPVIDSLTSVNASCADTTCPDGSASVYVSGGTSPYYYLWNTSDTSATISNVPSDTFFVTVTDANGCTVAGSVFIDFLVGDINRLLITGYRLLVFPNPAKEKISVLLSQNTGIIKVKLIDINGRIVQEHFVQYGLNSIILDVNDLPEGMYAVLVEINRQIQGMIKVAVQR